MNRIALGAATLAVAALTLAGCTFSANLTVPASAVASQAEEALATQDIVVTIDCGDDSVDLVDETVVDCLATDPATGTVYPAPVVIGDVDGGKYSISVELGEPEAGSAPAPTNDADGAPTVTAEALATIASDALAATLDFTPAVDCLDQTILVYVDAVYQCEAADADGILYPAYITITEVTGTDYKIAVDIGEQPLS